MIIGKQEIVVLNFSWYSAINSLLKLILIDTTEKQTMHGVTTDCGVHVWLLESALW